MLDADSDSDSGSDCAVAPAGRVRRRRGDTVGAHSACLRSAAPGPGPDDVDRLPSAPGGGARGPIRDVAVRSLITSGRSPRGRVGLRFAPATTPPERVGGVRARAAATPPSRGGPGAAFPRVWASARRGVRWAGAHRVRRPGGSPSTGDRTSDLHDVREEIALAHPVDHLPERVAAALRDMGWRRVEREGAVVRARRGSPVLFRLLGVFILGRRTLPVELRVVGRPDGRSPLVGHGSPRGGTRTRRSSPPRRGPWRHTGARWSVNRRAGVLAAARGRARGQASGVRWVWR